jgi:hypothetical protein
MVIKLPENKAFLALLSRRQVASKGPHARAPHAADDAGSLA